MEYPLNQSAWRRGWNDTKAGWKSLPFVILDAVVCVVVGAIFGWYWGLALFVFAMLCFWMGTTVSAPVKQRNEARQMLSNIPSRRKILADKLAEFYLAGATLKTAIPSKPDDGEGALGLYKEWFAVIRDFFNTNPTELGDSKLLNMVPDNSDLTVPIPDEWKLDEKSAYVYIMVSVQLSKLKKLAEEFSK
jgi:hypothetical protein